MSVLQAVSDTERRRRLGTYYTPDRVGRILANWAIRSPLDTVLEPSFGGCGLLEAACAALARLGCERPERRVFGCDVDPAAFEHLEEAFGDQDALPGFVYGDFLDCGPDPAWPAKFSTILANPPYIPYQRIPHARRREFSRRRVGIPRLGGRSSLWAYFVSHAVSMLREGGRMAWVLPGAMLQADYARPVREYLARHFERAVAIVVHERLFLEAGTDERTVVLLAEGHSAAAREGALEVGEVWTIEGLEAAVGDWLARGWSGGQYDRFVTKGGMNAAGAAAYERLARLDKCASLGSVARVRIGIVTGANDFFVLPASRLASAGLRPEDCSPIVSKFRCMNGMVLDGERQEEIMRADGRAFLVDVRAQPENPRILAYLDTFDARRRSTVSTFRKRKLWSEACDGQIPDAFFPVMHHHGPRLVLNGLGCNGTNTVHRVYFGEGIGLDVRRLAALSLLTTFSQLSAEMVGRRYGSGVLKHEPRDAERILLLLPDLRAAEIHAAFDEVDRLLRSGDHAGAGRAADRFLLSSLGEGSEKDMELLRGALHEARRRRIPNRRTRS